MLDRLMMGMVWPGVCVAAVFLLLSRHTAPACDADIVTSKLLPQLSAETGLSGLYLLNMQGIGGGLLAGTRQCVVDVATIQGLQPLARAHWLKVIYAATIDRTTGVVAVQSHLAGPVMPFLKAEPNT